MSLATGLTAGVQRLCALHREQGQLLERVLDTSSQIREEAHELAADPHASPHLRAGFLRLLREEQERYLTRLDTIHIELAEEIGL